MSNLIPNHFYDEYNGETLYIKNLLFLGMSRPDPPFETSQNKLFHFKMENGNHIKRQVTDTLTYRPSQIITR
jgi:hypothetical protein